MVTASSNAYLANLLRMKATSMDLSDIKSQITFAGMVTPLSILRRSVTLTVTSIRWEKTGHGEGTQRLMQLHGFIRLTSPYIHENIMRQEDC
jgi:hypothetical protein